MTDDLSSKLKEMLNDPDVMKKAAELAGMMGKGELDLPPAVSRTAELHQNSFSDESERDGDKEDSGEKYELTVREGRAGTKDHVALLRALMPYFSPGSRKKLEMMVKLLESYRIAEGMGLFK